MGGPALAVEALVAGYEPGLPIVRDTSILVQPAEIVAILGPNGAGKSTLVKAVAGLVPVSSGRVLLAGEDITHTPAHERIRKGLAFVPQTQNVFANLTVAENLELASFFLPRPRDRIAQMYALFPDLAQQRRQAAGRLSGGQRQMLAVARALVVGPRLIILDEPSAGLSPRLVSEVFAQLREIRAQGVTIVLVEQNVKAALGLADRAYVLVEGRPRAAGAAADLLRSPALGELYLGRVARLMLQHLADGLVIGSIIGLGAIGVTLTYTILGFANFAHGEYLSWGAYLALALLAFISAAALPAAAPLGPFSFGWPLLAALAGAAVLTAGLALVLDWALFARLNRRGSSITLVIASFGAALALRNLLYFLYGGIPEYYSREIQIALPLIPRTILGGLRMTPDQLFVMALTAMTVALLHLFLKRTTLGKAMRAVSRNPTLATVIGIDVRRVVRWTWVIGAALAAMAGVFAGLTIQLRPSLGFDLLLPLFAAAILGGIGSVYGAVLGGLIVGLAESFAVPLVGAEYRAAVAFLVLIAILLVRPTGILGERP